MGTPTVVINSEPAHPRGIQAGDTISHKSSDDSADQRNLETPTPIPASRDIPNIEGNNSKYSETISEPGDENEAEKNDEEIDNRNSLFAELLENWAEWAPNDPTGQPAPSEDSVNSWPHGEVSDSGAQGHIGHSPSLGGSRVKRGFLIRRCNELQRSQII